MFLFIPVVIITDNVCFKPFYGFVFTGKMSSIKFCPFIKFSCSNTKFQRYFFVIFIAGVVIQNFKDT